MSFPTPLIAERQSSPIKTATICGNCKADRKGCRPSVRLRDTCTWCERNGYKCSPVRSHKRKKLARFKCQQCRTKKIKCEPENRQWPARCQPCLDRNEECSAPQDTAGRKKQISRVDNQGVSTALMELSTARVSLGPEITDDGDGSIPSNSTPTSIFRYQTGKLSGRMNTEENSRGNCDSNRVTAVDENTVLSNREPLVVNCRDTPVPLAADNEGRPGSLEQRLMESRQDLEKVRLLADCMKSWDQDDQELPIDSLLIESIRKAYPETLRRVGDLALELEEQRDYARAENLYKRMLYCREALDTAFNYGNTGRVAVMLQLASVYQKMGETGSEIQTLETTIDFLLNWETIDDLRLMPCIEKLSAAYIHSCRQLSDSAADPQTLLIFPTTPLHQAVASGHPPVVAFVLGQGASYVNTRDIKGRTPLYMAINKGSVAIAELLITAGADVMIPCTSQNVTPMQVAIQKDSVECFCLLYNHSTLDFWNPGALSYSDNIN